MILRILLLVPVLMFGGCRGSGAEPPADAEGLAALLPADPDLSVVVVSFDALRVDHLGAYGDARGASPVIDAFAGDALVFDRAYSAAQSTPTSFAASFTGRYPFKVFLKWRLADGPTLAAAFAAGGWRTGGFFNNRQLDPGRNFGQGFEVFVVDDRPDEETFLERAVAWLDEVGDDRFFLWIHFISPHAPYRTREMSARFYTPDYRGRFAAGSGPVAELDSIADPGELARFKELYTGEVHYADHLFGMVREALAARGLTDRTLVALTADHGEGLMDHGVLFHQQVYEEVVRIPLIIRHPGGRRGVRTDVRTANVDFFPTLAGIAGLPVPADLDGWDVRTTDPARRPLLLTAMTHMDWRAMGMIWGDHKLIANCQRPSRPVWELYDLATDPREERDLYGTIPVLEDSLRAIIDALTNGGPCGAIRTASRGKSPTAGMSPEKIEQLRSLGYVR
jgi:arylsulfatase A-like enzyme